MPLKDRVPWQVKMGSKLVISRLPVPHAVWSRLGIFQHGSMEDYRAAQQIWHRHFDRAVFGRKAGGFTCLELGPGDSLFSAILARLAGAERTILVDVDAFASMDLELYRAGAQALIPPGESRLVPERWTSIDAMLADCHAEYLTDGLASLRSLPGDSVDFIWSQAVLEHVRRAEFLPTLQEMRRLLRADGFSSHEVDLKDHLARSLNSLRFSESRWESNWFATSGFYTNRLRHAEILELAAEAGFEASSSEEVTWPALPVPLETLDAQFRTHDLDDLRVASFLLTLVPCPA